MIGDLYSRRKFIRKYLQAGTIFLGGAFVLGYNSTRAIAQQQPKPDPKNDPKSASQNTVKPVSKGAPNPKDAGCADNPCEDMTGVSPGDLDKRKKLAYVNETPIPGNHCSVCALYLPPAEGKPCGGCLLFKGPVRAEAYCTYWAPINK